MARSRYPRDAGLTARMGITMLLLAVLFGAFITALIFAGVSLLGVVVIAVLVVCVQYFFSDRLALLAMKARVVERSEAPELHAIVDRLCALAAMDKPRVAMSPSPVPNAFATGRNQRVAVLCVTAGLVERLNEVELEAVLAHELSHVAHHDVVVMTVAGFLGIAAGLLIRLSFFGGMLRGGRRGNVAAVLALVMVVSLVIYAASFLLTRALSRYRELCADRSAALLTGNPANLASALVKVSDEMSRIPTRDLRSAQPVNALLFSPAVTSGVSFSSLFSTHPRLERRLDQLARLDAQLHRHP
jgi:heat shock protein HtpX